MPSAPPLVLAALAVTAAAAAAPREARGGLAACAAAGAPDDGDGPLCAIGAGDPDLQVAINSDMVSETSGGKHAMDLLQRGHGDIVSEIGSRGDIVSEIGSPRGGAAHSPNSSTMPGGALVSLLKSAKPALSSSHPGAPLGAPGLGRLDATGRASIPSLQASSDSAVDQLQRLHEWWMSSHEQHPLQSRHYFLALFVLGGAFAVCSCAGAVKAFQACSRLAGQFPAPSQRAAAQAIPHRLSEASLLSVWSESAERVDQSQKKS